MFQWKDAIAKSFEELFSRWAVKRLCKFMLKKKLGHFILGDIDIDQLDVQLRAGTIQLSDLALNVDYVNQKIGGEAGLIVKEGSIGSLLVQMPWKDKGCQVEVDGLELVIAPRVKVNSVSRGESAKFSQDGPHAKKGLGNLDHNLTSNASTSNSVDVHEGVKTIAKMVKWLLTNFEVHVKQLIVAFDPCLEKVEKEVGRRSILVLRISEAECGTCVSEDANSNSDAKVDNLFGLSRLKNFVKFQGALLELLQMEDVNNQSPPCDSKSTFGEWFSGSYFLNARTPVVTGENDGFSGTITLSIPWENGSLDIRKVDADVCVDPVKLKFQPSTIKWFLHISESLKNLDKDAKVNMLHKAEKSVYYNSESQFQSSVFGCNAVATDKVTSINENLYPQFCGSSKIYSSYGLLPGSYFISDWVSSSDQKNQEDGKDEIVFGASMHQFFECFDDIRTSQTALASSGLLNWTCSVFGALTAASNLASGSLHAPSEQQHIETNLKATMAGISIFLFFHDEDHKHVRVPKDGQTSVGSDSHVLVAESKGLHLVMQVSPQQMKFEVKVDHIELAEYMSELSDDDMGCGFCVCSKDVCSKTHLVHHLQLEVENALPPFKLHTTDPELKKPCELLNTSHKKENAVKVRLFKTSGVCHCKITLDSILGCGLSAKTSISLELPPFILWVNCHLVNMLIELLNQFKLDNNISSETSNEKHGLPNENMIPAPLNDSVSINIFLLNARIVLCFPFENEGDLGRYFLWDQFLVLDFSSPSTKRKENVNATDPISCPRKMHSSPSSLSLNLNTGNVDIQLVTSTFNDFGIKSCTMPRRRLCAQNILLAASRTGYLSVISMVWQEGSVTGPWIAEGAKFLATSGNSRGRDKSMEKGFEFASVSTVKDLEDFNSHTRQEIIMSSTSFLHIQLAPVTVHLGFSRYKELNHLFNQVINWLDSNPINVREESSVSQTSVLVECESVELSICLDKMESIKSSSIQNELPGSWCSFKLKILNFALLCVSNIGGVKDSTFLQLTHGEGKLCGSIAEVPDKEFLLISCSNSAMKRGDGEGSNALSSWFAGSDIIHFWDPESFHSFTSITVRCGTIIANGGRLDWFNGISSFFCLPSESEHARENNTKKDSTVVCSSFFVLNLVDIGLSYEPHLNFCGVQKEISEQYIACMVSASSINLSNTTMDNSIESDYKIRVQDLGFLICRVTGPDVVGGTYSADHIQNVGYVKVAGEALVEATLRTNCENGLLWEVECSESHIHLDTCNDTFCGLIRLVSQIQPLFAPDFEETFVHLQTRWNNVKQGNNIFYEEICINEEATPSRVNTRNIDKRSKSEGLGLMDEICEYAFQFDRNQTCEYESCKSQPDSVINLEKGQTPFLPNNCIPEFIEDYCISELRSLSELSDENQSSTVICKDKTRNLRNGKGNSGWYGDTTLRIVDDHIANVSVNNDTTQSSQGKVSFKYCTRNDDVGDANGRILLSNINFKWKMYAGYDWHDPRKRDANVCLELALPGINFKYDVFPVGEILVSKLSLSVQDINIYDNSRDAPWKMVLGYYHSKDNPREFSSSALKVDLETVRPDPLTPLDEYRVHISFLPLLLHLHQGQLDFLISYFGGESPSVDQSSGCPSDSRGSRMSSSINSSFGGQSIVEEALLPYIQKLDIWPVVIRIDYTPRHVDLAALRGGKYVELINLVPWKGVELQLKHVLAVGIYGWSSVCETIFGEWLEDISKNQIYKLFQGLPAIRSVVSLSSGAAKLVSLPLESYRKDNRLLKGMQRGTIAFLRSISLEAVGLGVHLAAGAHDILFQAECILSSTPPSVQWPLQSRTKTNIRSNQPKDAQQGIQMAFESLSDGLGKSASALLRKPLRKYQCGAGAGSALATAVQAAPVAAIAPASAAARALHCAFLGVRNSLDLEHKKESLDKYQGHSHQR